MKNKVLLVLVAFVAHSMICGQELPADRDHYVKILSASSEGLTLEISIDDFGKAPEMIDGKEYHLISLQRESSIKEIGFPEPLYLSK